MAPETHKNDHDAPTADGERQAELEAQLAQLRTEIFKRKRDEDVRQWLFEVETLCRINGHDVTDSNDTLPAISITSMEEPASGWFLFWASRTPAEEQTWGQFIHDALAHFEALNYQAALRQKLRQLRQTGDIEEYNRKYSSLIFRVENMSEVNQVSYYCDGLKRATQAYVKLQNATTLSEAMDQASKYEMSHFGGERRPDREKPEREQRLHPLVLNCAPLFAVEGNMKQRDNKIGAKFLLDCERMIKVKLGNNNIGEAVLKLAKITVCLGGAPNYHCVAVVFDIPDEFDCALRMPFFVDEQPEIDGKRRCFKMDDSVGASAVETSISSWKCSLTIKTLLKGEVEANERPTDVVEKFSKSEKKNAKESLKKNSAYPVNVEYKDSVFTPELPDGLPMERDIEHRIDVKDPNIAMYRKQWRLSPDQKAEINKWVREMIAKGLIQPNISPHAALTFCVRKPVGCGIVHDYRNLNSNTIRQCVPMTRKEDVFDSMAGAYYFSCMDLMSAYYQVGMKMDHSNDINKHLRALHDVLEILKKNKLYVKLSKCVFCADEIPCLGDFIGRNGVRIDPDKVQTIRDWPNGIADALSRRPDLKPETKDFHDLLVTSFNETSYQLRVTEIKPNDNLIKEIIAGYAKEKVIGDIRRAVKRRGTVSAIRGVSEKQFKPYFEEKNLIWYEGSTDEQPRIVVPNIVALKHRIIAEVHDTNYGGHPGADRTYLKLRSDLYWPRMVRTIKKYIADCDGQTERTNRTLEEYLRCFVSPRQDNWDVHLANAEFVINSVVNTSIKMSPFEADIGYVPQALEDDQARMTDVYDSGRTEQLFKVGDQIYLSTKHFDTAYTDFPNSRKLGPKWIGPYSVVRTIHKHAYEINLPPGLKLYPVFNTGSLKPYDTPTRLSRPNQVILHDSTVGQIVEAIVGKRKRLCTIQYQVKWVGEEQLTWEPHETYTK
ncbi:Hypothetical protein PHPALM_19875 [Phytophthora palmivora]|uniref:Chromo domain-containing protein n=1 Tax=Phytophthora palmivora TaxID=4796 RepID=A0A2P4XG96_9STRA|nr:Hypothetical protein PHPALM_19875 [Phytophthora palmivora]